MNLRYASIMIASMFALLVTIGAVAIAAELSKYADPCEWIAFDLCNVKKEAAVDSIPGISSHRLQGETSVRKLSVIEVSKLKDTGKCVIVVTPPTNTAAVVGTYDGVMRELNLPECKK